MHIVREIHRRARHVLPQVAAACLVAYFAYHVIYGDRGFLAYLHVQQELKEARLTAEVTEGERARLERRIALLRPENLDPDMLDERARELLGLSQPGDVVIFFNR